MPTHEMATVIFDTTGRPGDEQLLREYVLDAVDRLPAQSGCAGVGFNPFARKADLAEIETDGGVLVRFWGSDLDAVLAEERDRWDELVATGVAQSWDWSEEDDALVDYLGDQGADRYLEFLGLASQLSKQIYERFETPPDPVDAYPGEARRAPAGVGWWRLLHLLTIQQNYRYEQELDAYVEGIRSTLHTIAEFDSAERAHRDLDGIIDALTALHDALQATGG